MSFTFNLGFNSLKNVLLSDTSGEFVFYVDGKSILTTQNRARCLSNRVCHQLICDCTNTSINIFPPNGSEKNFFSVFNLFLKTMDGPVTVDPDDMAAFASIALQLHNEDFITKFESKIQDFAGAVAILQRDSYNYEAAKFISDNLTAFIEVYDLKVLDCEALSLIFKIHFQESSTDVHLIFQIISGMDSFIPLCFSLPFEELEAHEVITVMRCMTDDTWEYFGEILNCLSIYFNSLEKEIVVENETMFNGIFQHFWDKEEENPATNGTVYLNCNGSADPDHPIQLLLEYEGQAFKDFFYNYYVSKPLDDQNYIEFDFTTRKVELSSYSIQSNSGDSSKYCHPKSWEVIGSNDRVTWTLVDKRVDNSVLNKRYGKCKFICPQKSDAFRYFRYVQTDSHFPESEFHINLTAIEFFGSIIECKDYKQ